jgi:acyl-coenzyme A synthetase/AMP-(fatty) acid ligase
LRISIFGGETLTLEAARAWARSAPNSTVDNVYGPTEATIEVLHQRLTEPPCVTAERGSLALGLPYPETKVAIFDAERGVLPFGEVGEIAVAGFQLAAGYLGRPDLTEARFTWIDGTRWYLTGDTGYQDGEGRFHRLGRSDDQVKIRGHRVELGDVESHLREVCDTELAAAVPWPLANGGATGLVAFVASALKAPREIRAALEARLPAYMVPQTVWQLETMPLTAHGKVDRQALMARLIEEK